MNKNVYKIEYRHMICDSYYLEADSKEEAEKLFHESFNDIAPDETEMLDSDAEMVGITLYQDRKHTGYLYDVTHALSETRKKLLEIIEEQYDAGARIPLFYNEFYYTTEMFMGYFVGDYSVVLRRDSCNNLVFSYYQGEFKGVYSFNIDLADKDIPIEVLMKLAEEMK